MKRNEGMEIVILVLLLLAHLSAGGAWAEDPQGGCPRDRRVRAGRRPPQSPRIPLRHPKSRAMPGRISPNGIWGLPSWKTAASRTLRRPRRPRGPSRTSRDRGGDRTSGRLGRDGRPDHRCAGRRFRLTRAHRASAPRAWRRGPSRDCAAGLAQDAETGGSLRIAVTWCVGAACETTTPRRPTPGSSIRRLSSTW